MRHFPGFRLVVAAGTAALLAAGLLVLAEHRADDTPEQGSLAVTAPSRNTFRQFTTDADLHAGRNEGARVVAGSLTMAKSQGRRAYAGRSWDWSRWTSPWVAPGHAFTQLVPTWNAVTPPDTFVQVLARTRSTTGKLSRWKLVSTWSTRDDQIRRSSGPAHADALSRLSTDTLTATARYPFARYQLRTLLFRRAGTAATPSVRSLQAVATRPSAAVPTTSRAALPARALSVPAYSQMTHRGQYPQWGGGGEAWCSPTALAMVLGYYRSLPSPQVYSWVDRRYADPWVDHVARATYDYAYRGAGNWAFNTAYAANLVTGDAYVTRMGDLREAERLIAAGIPVIASISFGKGQLRGAPIGSTPGHLVVITGFTASGDVLVNDPAAPNNASVRRTYNRAQFERAWLRHGSGTAYVVRDAGHPLPR